MPIQNLTDNPIQEERKAEKYRYKKMNKTELIQYREEAYRHLTTELLPFWTSRMKDEINGGYLTHFDVNGNDTG